MQNIRPLHLRPIALIACVLLLHALALWCVQSGLLQRAVLSVDKTVVPVMVMTEIPAPVRAPTVLPSKAAPQLPGAAARTPAAVRPHAEASPSPAAAAAPTPAPAPAPAPSVSPSTATATAPASQSLADSGTSGHAAQGVAQGAATANLPNATSAAPARVELPSSDADYLHNPKSEYPRLSRQRNEQGRVQVSVLIGTDGTAQKAEIKVSSGFDRLDQAALATVKSWRFVPGKRGGVPEAMWFTVPINFVLE